MKKGQVLLIVVMLLATALTVALTSTYQSVTETQLTKLEEENQKALAAVEAGIEKALQSKRQGNFTFTSLGLSNLSGIDTSQSSVEISNQGSTTFVTPLLQKDEQYTFYLSSYDPQTKNFSGNSTQQNINVCFGSSTPNPALEITLIKSDYTVKRYVVNPRGNTIIQNGIPATSPPPPGSCPDSSFNNQYQIVGTDIGTNTRFLIVRVIGNGATRIGFKATNPFPIQGSTIISTAKTQAGVEKKVQLFQSYPQIPAEFFVTSF